jgi:putative ABC transport system permease protein
MFRTTLATLRAHSRRLLGTASAVLIGIAFLAGTLVLGDTLRAGFTDLFAEVNAGTDAFVRSDEEIDYGGGSQVGLVDAALIDEISEVDGVTEVVGDIERFGQIVGADGDPVGGGGPPTYAGNWITSEELSSFHLLEGEAPAGDREVVIDRGAADQGDLAVGDTTTVRLPDPVEVTIVGIAGFGSSDSAAGSTFVAFTDEAAAELLVPSPDQLTGIRVAAGDGVEQAELVRRIEEVLPGGAEAITGAELTDEQQGAIDTAFLGLLERFLLVFAGIALVVASLNIHNTFSVVMAQRTRESALLRALGASRRQVLSSVLVEAVLVGAVASALGVVGGALLARALAALLGAAAFDMPASSYDVGLDVVAVSLVVGVVVTVLASLAPAVKASRVLPLAALRDVAVERPGPGRRALVGAAVTLVGVVLTVAGVAAGGSVALAGLGALVVVVGVVLLGPVVAGPVCGVLGWPLGRLRGTSGLLARENAMRNPRRTANTATALMVGVAVVAAFTVVAATLRADIDRTTERAFAADLVIASGGLDVVGLSPSLAGEIAELPEVETATGLGRAPVRMDGEDRLVSTADGPSLAGVMELDVRDGSIADVVEGTVAVSESYADENDLAVGDPVAVRFSDGESEELSVAAVYDADDVVGTALLSEETWAGHAVQQNDTTIAIRLASGVSLAEGEAAAQAVADRHFAPDVQTRDEYADASTLSVNQLLAVVYVLLALAIVIAAMGIANTLSLSIHERIREVGLLRAVGQTRRELRTMVRGESIIVSAFGAVGGVGLGCFLGWALARTINGDDAETFALPVGQLLAVLVVGALVGIVAAIRPARRAARLDVLEAIATD